MPERRLCRLEAIPDGQARGFTVGAGAGKIIILVARRGGAVHGYVNSCPHVGAPLDWTPDRFMSPDGQYLMCAMHGALFLVEDGACVSGPCVGKLLTPVPVGLDDDHVVYHDD
ncbi:MAG TPA: Rieske (2Fe-2S) protein [Azospirillaceae bacterium]|nr:Rieske (2Fe-2S) protein [Azospirillaceae bacterium]